MSERPDPDKLLELARAGMGPTSEQRAQVGRALAERLDRLPPPGGGGGGGGAGAGAGAGAGGGGLPGLPLGASVGGALGLAAAAAMIWYWASEPPTQAPPAEAAQAGQISPHTPAQTPAGSRAVANNWPPRNAEPPAVPNRSQSETAHATPPTSQAPASAMVEAKPQVAGAQRRQVAGSQRRQVAGASRSARGARNAPTQRLAARTSKPRPRSHNGSPQRAATARPPAAGDTTGAAAVSTGSMDRPASATSAAAKTDQAGTSPGETADDAPRSHLAAELALIDGASQALRTSRPGRALALLERHATLYGQGSLGAEREGLTALAHCANGDALRARALAARFMAQHPGSPLAARVRHATDCQAP